MVGKKNNWKNSQRKEVKNKALWEELDQLVGYHTVKWHWVKGHSGHEQNERVDEIARQAASGVSDDNK